MRVAHEFLEIPQRLTESLYSQYLQLESDTYTTIHTAVYARNRVQPHVVTFSDETYLVKWCLEQEVPEAIVGGFFRRDKGLPLGELWQSGEQRVSESFDRPWGQLRGCLHIDRDHVSADYRHLLPKEPGGDLLQAGPLLVSNGEVSPSVLSDFEGFSRGAHQFDSDITTERHPRAAIGISDSHIFTVVCDGRSSTDAGMYLHELATYMKDLGCTQALNLDGGGSATLVSNMELINKPRDINHSLLLGRPIYNAIVFEPL